MLERPGWIANSEAYRCTARSRLEPSADILSLPKSQLISCDYGAPVSEVAGLPGSRLRSLLALAMS